MKSTVRARLWLEAGVASLTGFLAVFTLVWRGWIEAVTGLDPDHHSGLLEWAIVAGLFVICVKVSVVARAEWMLWFAAGKRRMRTTPLRPPTYSRLLERTPIQPSHD